MKVCKNCGTKLKLNMIYCPKCGVPVRPEKKMDIDTKSITRTLLRSWKFWAVFAVGMLLIIRLFGGVRYYLSGDVTLSSLSKQLTEMPDNIYAEEVDEAYAGYIEKSQKAAEMASRDTVPADAAADEGPSAMTAWDGTSAEDQTDNASRAGSGESSSQDDHEDEMAVSAAEDSASSGNRTGQASAAASGDSASAAAGDSASSGNRTGQASAAASGDSASAAAGDSASSGNRTDQTSAAASGDSTSAAAGDSTSSGGRADQTPAASTGNSGLSGDRSDQNGDNDSEYTWSRGTGSQTDDGSTAGAAAGSDGSAVSAAAGSNGSAVSSGTTETVRPAGGSVQTTAGNLQTADTQAQATQIPSTSSVTTVTDQTAAAADEAAARETLLASYESYLDKNLAYVFDGNYSLTRIGSEYYATAWVNGAADEVEAIRAGKITLAEWGVFRDSLVNRASGMYDQALTRGLSDVHLNLEFLNDKDLNRVLISFRDGAVVYDVMN